MSSAGFVVDTTTVFSLLSTLAILFAAYTTSLYALPSSASGKTRFLFIWHAFDALIHFILEGSYLQNCFYSFTPLPLSPSIIAAPPLLPDGVHFLGHADRLYGAAYGTNPFSALWREYAKADARWAGTDLTVVSLELLTVFVGGPLAVYICVCLARSQWGKAWFWMCVLATGELYGGEFCATCSFLSFRIPGRFSHASRRTGVRDASEGDAFLCFCALLSHGERWRNYSIVVRTEIWILNGFV